MKKLLFLPIIALAMLLAGCRNPNSNVGPGLLRLGVSSGAAYSMSRYPQAVPGVKAGADIICSVATGDDLSPVRLVAALDAYEQNTPEAVFILNAAIGAYTIAYNGLSDTNAAKPYVQAVCDGLSDAVLLSPMLLSPAESSRRNSVAAITDNRWPQVRFKPR